MAAPVAEAVAERVRPRRRPGSGPGGQPTTQEHVFELVTTLAAVGEEAAAEALLRALAEALAALGAVVDHQARNREGYSLLQLAVRSGSVRAVQTIVQAGGNLADSHGPGANASVLHLATHLERDRQPAAIGSTAVAGRRRARDGSGRQLGPAPRRVRGAGARGR